MSNRFQNISLWSCEIFWNWNNYFEIYSRAYCKISSYILIPFAHNYEKFRKKKSETFVRVNALNSFISKYLNFNIFHNTGTRQNNCLVAAVVVLLCTKISICFQFNQFWEFNSSQFKQYYVECLVHCIKTKKTHKNPFWEKLMMNWLLYKTLSVCYFFWQFVTAFFFFFLRSIKSAHSGIRLI